MYSIFFSKNEFGFNNVLFFFKKKENKDINFFSIIVLEAFVSIQTNSLQSIT